MAANAQEPAGGREAVPDNSDPTGIGPPPPGATTEVEGGRGVTTAAPVPEGEAGSENQAGK
jgi:hypothetical protein